MEYLDIVDEKGNPIGRIIERKEAHEKGIRHRTSQIWILRKIDQHIEVLIQKRSAQKDSYPLYYDISSAGHVLAGTSYEECAIRELYEELGIVVQENQLHFIGMISSDTKNIFHHKLFHNVQVSRVYVLWYDGDFILQKEEISEVKWVEFYKCMDDVENNKFLNCIKMSQLKMIEKYLEEGKCND